MYSTHQALEYKLRPQNLKLTLCFQHTTLEHELKPKTFFFKFNTPNILSPTLHLNALGDLSISQCCKLYVTDVNAWDYK